MKNQVKSLIISSDFNGKIIDVLCNSLFDDAKKLAGRSFLSFIEPESRQKAMSFLNNINIEKRVFNIELNIELNCSIMPLRFSGIRYKNHILIIITNEHTFLNDLFEEIALVNNEQANMLRALSKEVAKFSGSENASILHSSFNQISQLNNELINTQRELAAKNKELAILNEQLREKSIKDLLTGLFNRRYFDEKMSEELIRATRLKYKIVIVSIDINNFKFINDNYGHGAGDKLLLEFAGILKDSLRKNFDSIFRFGGDEFVVLLVNCETGKALEILENINKKLVKTNKEVSISYGAIQIILESIKSMEDVYEYIKKSDRLMYEFKEKYKNSLKK